jgi:hypothetical protein
LAYRIIDTGADGGILVSPLGLQEGAERVAAAENIISVRLNEDCNRYDSHSAPFFTVLKQFWQSRVIWTMSYALTFCFPRPFFLITTSCNLEGPFLTLASEAQGFGFPARRTAHDNPAPRFQGAETMADIALIALEGAHQFLVAARDPALRPLVIDGQPA